jgi:hypothetical protein
MQRDGASVRCLIKYEAYQLKGFVQDETVDKEGGRRRGYENLYALLT